MGTPRLKWSSRRSGRLLGSLSVTSEKHPTDRRRKGTVAPEPIGKTAPGAPGARPLANYGRGSFAMSSTKAWMIYKQDPKLREKLHHIARCSNRRQKRRGRDGQ